MHNPRRAVVVATKDGSARSSGYIVSSKRILTTKHGVIDQEGNALSNLMVGVVDGHRLYWSIAQVIFASPTADVAILESDTLAFGALNTVVPTQLAGREHANGHCKAVAFPHFLDDLVQKTPRRAVIVGLCDADEMLPSPQLLVTVSSAIPSLRDGWKGASGASLFFGGRLVAIVARQETLVEKHCLTAIPLDQVYADPAFWSAYGADRGSVLLGERTVAEMRGLDAAQLMPSRWLYLHYLDPELQRAVSSMSSSVSIREVITTQLATTYGILYSPISFAWESNSLSDRHLASIMGDSGQFVYLSKYRTFDEYIESRVEFYSDSNDGRRIYTTTEIDTFDEVFDRYVRQKLSNTTEFVSNGLTAWAASRNHELLEFVIRCLSERAGAGVTLDMFKSRGVDERFGTRVTAALDLQITRLFTRVYLDEVDGDIFTSVPRFDWIDAEGRNFPFYDWKMLDAIGRKILPELYDTSTGSIDHMRNLLDVRGGSSHVRFCENLFAFVDLLSKLSEHFDRDITRASWLQRSAQRYFTASSGGASGNKRNFEKLFDDAAEATQSALHLLQREVHI